jgi:hypothetical protein
MPFDPGLVFTRSFLFPAHARSEREASVSGAIRGGAGFSLLADETNESDAVLAKHFLVFLSCPDPSGRPGAKGAALQASKAVFRRLPAGLFGQFQKAQPAISEGNRNPLGPGTAERSCRARELP